ncbi:MAG: KH domain-containing protein [Firmicutes bacterium]|nr:KH domain-containing protein [Bacillota bacterium]
MEMIIKEGKEKEEIISQILEENNLKEEDILYQIQEKKVGLFNKRNIEIKAYLKKDLIEEVKTNLKEIVQGLGIDVNFEVKQKDDYIIVKMYSDNNPILIGKNGRTLKALEILVKQIILVKYQVYLKIILDVENYKDKVESSIIRLAKKIAKEVKQTNIEARLDDMNAFERRIVHNALADFTGIKTISEGKEPYRHVVIKPDKKED